MYSHGISPRNRISRIEQKHYVDHARDRSAKKFVSNSSGMKQGLSGTRRLRENFHGIPISFASLLSLAASGSSDIGQSCVLLIMNQRRNSILVYIFILFLILRWDQPTR